eukprot:m51a1_g12680 hypothetical protein (353) ;mRNA; f:71-1268
MEVALGSAFLLHEHVLDHVRYAADLLSLADAFPAAFRSPAQRLATSSRCVVSSSTDCPVSSSAYGIIMRTQRTVDGSACSLSVVDFEDTGIRSVEAQRRVLELSHGRCAHSLPLHAAWVDRDALYLAHDEALPLSDALRAARAGLREDIVCAVLHEACAALQLLHDRGRFYGDLRAQNVLVTARGDVRLAFFDVALCTGPSARINTTGSLFGSPHWKSPEEIKYDRCLVSRPKADVWALGITAVELCNGEPPHADKHPMRVIFIIAAGKTSPQLGAGLSAGLRGFVALCLEQDPERRPAAGDLAYARSQTPEQRAAALAGLAHALFAKDYASVCVQRAAVTAVAAGAETPPM